MAKPIMIQGTMSNVGKSVLIAGMCRAFFQDGYKVAPFCAQSMVQHTFITKDGEEISKMQALQSEAANITPEACMNPILLKPTETMETQVIMNGVITGNMSAFEFSVRKKELKQIVMEAYETLEKKNDIVILEGAGSPVEMNLNKDDIVNMGVAEMTEAPVLLTGDIDRGGIMAQLLGTMGLFTAKQKAYVKGLVFNKFRGVKSTLEPMIRITEERGGVPVLGVLPYVYTNIDDDRKMNECFETEDNINVVDIAVIKLPHTANYVDFNPFECMEEVSLHYATTPAEIGNPDIIMMPDSTEVYYDLMWLRQNGMETKILQYAAREKVIFGICGGYQMLGEQIEDDENGKFHGMGLLPVTSYSSKEYRKWQEISGEFIHMEGRLSEISGTKVSDCLMQPERYETKPKGKALFRYPLGEIGTHRENIYGMNVRGLFHNEDLMKSMIKCILTQKGLDGSRIQAFTFAEYKEKQYNRLADILRENINMETLYDILQKGIG